MFQLTQLKKLVHTRRKWSVPFSINLLFWGVLIIYSCNVLHCGTKCKHSAAHTLQGSAVEHIPYRAVQYNRRQCNVMQYNTIIDTPRGGGGGGHFTDSSSCSLILIHVSLSILIRINVTSVMLQYGAQSFEPVVLQFSC